MQPMQPPRIQTQGLAMHNSIPEYTSMDDYHRNVTYHSPHPMMQNGLHPIVPSHGIEYSDSPYSMMSPQSAHTQLPSNPFRMPEEPANMGYMAQSPGAGSPGWMLPSPSTTMYSGAPQPSASQQLRYPVLQPLVPHLVNIMPVTLACDLLELYFQSSSSAFMQPVSPYVLGYVFRKRSFLRSHSPRMCSPALLASMLWIGCLTSESPYLSSSPSARSQLSEKLINLTISLLKPLVHQSHGESDPSPTTFTNNGIINGVTMGGFGMPAQNSEIGLRKSSFMFTVTCSANLSFTSGSTRRPRRCGNIHALGHSHLGERVQGCVSPLVERCLVTCQGTQTRQGSACNTSTRAK
jgi:hypothetical protein